MREKVGKSRNTVFFPMIWGQSRLAKAAGAEPAGQRSDEKLHAVVARSTFASQNAQNTPGADHFWQLRCQKSARRCGAKHISKSKWFKMHKTPQPRTTFGSWDVEKVHAVVARSTFPSQNAQNTPRSDHFWKFRCGKSARRCGAKHISKWKCTKHNMFAPLLEVPRWKKCAPLWCEAHVEVKMYKAQHVRGTFRGSDVASLHYTTLHYTPLHCTALQLQLHNYTPLRSTTLHYTPLHSTALHYTPLHSTTLNHTTLHYTTLHYTTLHYLPLHLTTLHYTPLHYNYNYTTTLHYDTLHYTKLHYTTLHYTTLHYTTLHYTTLHYLPLHFTTLRYTTQRYTTTTTTNTQLHSTTLHNTKLHYTTLHYTTLHSTTLHYTTLHYITLHYITLNDTAPQIDRSTDRQTDR